MSVVDRANRGDLRSGGPPCNQLQRKETKRYSDPYSAEAAIRRTAPMRYPAELILAHYAFTPAFECSPLRVDARRGRGADRPDLHLPAQRPRRAQEAERLIPRSP